MQFFVGLHQPSDARHFDACMVSINRLRDRKSSFKVGDWIMDSGAFSEISLHGEFRSSIVDYASEIRRWAKVGNMLAAVSQDYMCEPFILAKTGMSVKDHQLLTIGRYLSIASFVGNSAYVMPVLQGFWPEEYVSHIRQYATMIHEGQWVGVGSVCKRNARIESVESVLVAINRERPDLRLHGFGLKTTALRSSIVRRLLFSADSMAWSYAARKSGGDRNSWRTAAKFCQSISEQRVKPRQFQDRLDFEG